jgi:hypothetical protein
MDDGNANGAADAGRTVAWPWYVRWLAVAYVFSMLIGPVGFVVMGLVGGYLLARDGHGWNGAAALAFAAAVGCPLACATFRWWFRSWGKRHWPDGKPGGVSSSGDS